MTNTIKLQAKTTKVLAAIEKSNKKQISVKEIASLVKDLDVFQVSGCLSALQTEGIANCFRRYNPTTKRMHTVVEMI